MAWVAVTKQGREFISMCKPIRVTDKDNYYGWKDTFTLSGIIPKSGIALSTLHGAAIQRKTPALDWGKCLSSGGLGDFYCWRFCQEVVYLVSNLRCKGSDYFNNNNNNKVNKVKTIVYLDFI